MTHCSQYQHIAFHSGLDDIGYNFLVGEDGRAYQGRGWEIEGVHTEGCNTRAIGIAFIGDFSERLPNEAALQAMVDLMAHGVRQVV